MKLQSKPYNPLRREETAVRIRAFSERVTARLRYTNQIETSAPAGEVPGLLAFLQASGFRHLANILCVDRIAEDEMEIVYNLWSYELKVHLTLKTRVSRARPKLPSVHALWPQAQVYEQEVHEFFGVVFDGNPDLGPLFLHNWKDAPPLRKDFDTEEYSRRAYGFLEDDEEGAVS